MERKKVVIIGSGPAGYTAAIYTARANLEPVLFEGFKSGTAGGQLMLTTEVENYPGFSKGILGPDLMIECKEQAKRFGSQILLEDVINVDFSKRPFIVNGTDHQFEAESVIVATGAFAKRLDIEGSRDGEFWQKGVTACAVCDGANPIFRDQDLYVIGGGDSACEEAIFLTKFGKRVFLVHRRDQLRASKIMQERVKNHPKIEILWNTVVMKVEGDKVVRSVTIENSQTKKQEKREAAGLFFAIGHEPNTAFLNRQLELNEKGYVVVKPGTTQTSVEGVYAAGDVQDFIYRQAVTAAGTGCMAAIDCERWLSHQGIGE
ncbi:MAG: Thioredoxin reductase [Chlamydiae bacterium]|nr:Thioredoxin reductase [Chlamydiota bacterium]